MEGFIPILFLWLLIFMLGSISKKKKAGQQTGPAAGRQNAAPGEGPASAPPASPVPQAAPAPRPRPQTQAAPLAPAPKPHHAEPLKAHMHEPVMGEEGVGTEGIDCCHEYMLGSQPEPEGELPILSEKTEDERAKALLQGVIFSEILGRRPVKRYGGQRT